MGTVKLRLPDSIYRRACEIAQQEGVSVDRFISSAVSEKLSAILTEESIQARAEQADLEKAKQVLAGVSARAPMEGDEL